ILAFLNDIADHPEDDALRLIFADWLDDHGQPARAELFRVQCTLAALPEGDPRRAELELRERDVRGRVLAGAWPGPLSSPYEFKFHRGLTHLTLFGSGNERTDGGLAALSAQAPWVEVLKVAAGIPTAPGLPPLPWAALTTVELRYAILSPRL